MLEPLITEKILREEIFQVTAVTMWSWRKSGHLDALKPIQLGRRRYYRRENVEEFLLQLSK